MWHNSPYCFIYHVISLVTHPHTTHTTTPPHHHHTPTHHTHHHTTTPPPHTHTHTHTHTMPYLPYRPSTDKTPPPPPRAFAKQQDKRYNSRTWRKMAKHHLGQHPTCAVDGCDRVPTVCDHITPVTHGGNFWHGPFQSLCKQHHNQKSARERHM